MSNCQFAAILLFPVLEICNLRTAAKHVGIVATPLCCCRDSDTDDAPRRVGSRVNGRSELATETSWLPRQGVR